MPPAPDINEYIASLKASGRLGDQVVFHGGLPGKESESSTLKAPWPYPMETALKKIGIQKLYSHQVQAMDRIRSGLHTVVATPTASGKTLIYNLPVFEKIITEPGSRGLYLFPLKALARDQLKTFQSLATGMGIEHHPAAIYDGDTSAWNRKKIRTNLPNVIITNPEMVHLSFLPYHQNWAEFFSGLKFVVIDEVHTYRGVMGSHMAQVFRRLNRICAHYGSSPTFIFCSATISNPGDLCRRLTGLDVSEVKESGAPGGNRHMLFMNPVEGASQTAIALLKAALHRELRTIVYTQSRKMTELISMWAQNRSGTYAGRISAYRAGFLAEERRNIEAKLSNGELLAVISTSALELGIDIGDLDLCILVGYPGTVISILQRGGRVGRSGRDSATILIAGEDALDQYFMRHPEELMNREPEAAVINPYNSGIVSRHLVCAAAELPLKSHDPYVLEAENSLLVKALVDHGDLLESGEGETFYSNRKRPHGDVDLRGSGQSYTIHHSGTGEVIGEIDGFRAFKETHPGAVYLHMGETFQVDVLDISTKTVQVSKAGQNYYTRAMSHKDLEILQIYKDKRIGNTVVCTGRVKVTEQVTGYEKWAIYGKKKLNRIELDLPPLIFESDALWFKIPGEIVTATEKAFLHFMGGIHALEHAAISIFPLLVLTDRNDLGGLSTPFHPRVEGPAVFIYDAVPGGAGLVLHAFEKAESLLKHTLDLISQCPCENGCPSCVHSPKCGSGNRPIDKAAALFILTEMTPSVFPLEKTVSPEVRRTGKKSIQKIRIRRRKNSAGSMLHSSGMPMDDPGQGVRMLDPLRQESPSQTQPDIPLNPEPAGKHPVMPIRGKKEKGPSFRFGVVDIETRRSADEVGGWNRADRMGVSCLVLYDSRKDEYLEFLENQIPDFLSLLKAFDLMVGFNVKRFDYKVLSGYTDFNFNSVNTLDILEDIHTHLGYRLSLDSLATSTLGTQKSGNGLQALEWWKQGKIREILDYCRKDVEITRSLFEFGLKNEYLLFTNKAKSLVRIPVKWKALIR
ncbi:MAG: DEAD/DEAH box helicase [Desulfobacteraceae bacterium]|nr:DEAD/DEAH box helicase [Desulfobacteraceae bacterium]